MSKPVCYVASPYGFAEGTEYWYNKVFLPLLSKYVTVLDPWAVDNGNIPSPGSLKRHDTLLAIGDNCYRMVEKAKLLVAILDQEPPDNGTVAEVVWATAHHIPVIGYRNDLRSSGEVGLPYNLMVGAAIRKSGGVEVSSLAELEKELKNV